MKMPKVISDVLAKQKGTITSQDINALGISRTMLGRYVSAGLLERVGRGLYTSVYLDYFILDQHHDKTKEL